MQAASLDVVGAGPEVDVARDDFAIWSTRIAFK